MKDVIYGWIDTIKPLTCDRLGSAICWGDGKGRFKINDLPTRLQEAPIFSFQKITSRHEILQREDYWRIARRSESWTGPLITKVPCITPSRIVQSNDDDGSAT